MTKKLFRRFPAALFFLATLAVAAPDDGMASSTAKRAPVFTPSVLPYPFSSAVQVGDILYLSGDIGVDASGRALVPGGIVAETRTMFDRIGATLQRHGLDFDDLFKCTVMLADMSEWPAFNAIYAEYFEAGSYPTRSAMGVAGLALGARVEMECVAWNPQ
ncbi:translational inhibitor protein [Luminiphilus syltensis NOR5-1B]|uniref:Translational inhibitor protein n=1 Tax=Luminiphilus syltensis NOR5-1B TaxID=565045 RepID=B8KVD5_9GAMM|nr:RidA family protein [Luminiphilus syltensis]EED36417.1 translational inhibitor protein [Luminiphilus syltensis NOR5-1B]